MERKPGFALAAGLMVGSAVWGATTRSFSLGADLATATAIASLAGAGVLWRQRYARDLTSTAEPVTSRAGVLAWVVLLAALVALELAEFASSPRSAHPTISSMLDILDAHPVTRGLVWLAWLALGAWLFADGRSR